MGSHSWTPFGLLLCAMPTRPEHARSVPMPTLAIILTGAAYGNWSALAIEGEGGWLKTIVHGERRYLFGGPNLIDGVNNTPPKIADLSEAIRLAEEYANNWIQEQERSR